MSGTALIGVDHAHADLGKRDTIVHGRDPYNAEPSRAALAEHPLTSAEVFYSRNHGPIPEIDADGWSLTVDRLVG